MTALEGLKLFLFLDLVFDEMHLLGTSEATQILFAESLELSDTQLASLGLV